MVSDIIPIQECYIYFPNPGGGGRNYLEFNKLKSAFINFHIFLNVRHKNTLHSKLLKVFLKKIISLEQFHLQIEPEKKNKNVFKRVYNKLNDEC